MIKLTNLLDETKIKELKPLPKDKCKELLILQQRFSEEFKFIMRLRSMGLLQSTSDISSPRLSNAYNLSDKSLIPFNNEIVNDVLGYVNPVFKEYSSFIKSMVNEGYEFPKSFKYYELDKLESNSSKEFRIKDRYHYYDSTLKLESSSRLSMICSNELEGWDSKFNNLININLNSIKDVCNKLDFVILPLEYLSDKAWEVDTNFSKSELILKKNEFLKLSKYKSLGSNIYVLCPLRFYDLMSHSTSKTYKQIYYGSGLSQYKMMINMNMPMFRSIFSSLGNLDERVKDLEDVTKNLKESVKSIESNLNMLQSQLVEISTEFDNHKMESMKTFAQINNRVKELEEWRICMMDPMIFQVNTNSSSYDINSSDDHECTIGFAWGPEFSKEFADMLQLSVNNTKRGSLPTNTSKRK